MAHTPTPWGWVIHDHSTASLGVLPDPGLGDPLVLTISPCRSCIDRAEPKEWQWGRCTTPSKEDAEFILEAVNSHASLVEENKRMREALTPSAETKAAYIGEFSFSHEQWNVEGDDTETVKVTVPWTTIKEIMAAILERSNA